MKKWEWNRSGRKGQFKTWSCRCAKAQPGRPHYSACCCYGYETRPTVKARLRWRDHERHEWKRG